MIVEPVVGLTSIIILGIATQWVAWRFGLPSILMMLLVGFMAGPVSGLLNPDQLFGTLLFPIVSISVAIILFEGGLSLKLRELRPIRAVVINLVTIGALVTWLLSAYAAYYFLALDVRLALLFGAILVVSGPTVIIPLLIQVRPIGQVGSVMKWEGIVNDPVGATLAVLVFEALSSSGVVEVQAQVLGALINTILIGAAFGLMGAIIIILTLRYYLVPDFLQNSVSLMVVLGAYTASNTFQDEAGLVTVTIMGVILANQTYVNIQPIVYFKENLRVMLISSLFIILAARLELGTLAYISPNSLLFLAALILVIRPTAVLLSTFRSSLKWSERFFLSWMAPRGIVAAAVASIFALELDHAGVSGADRLAPLAFLVIIGTVSIYGLTAVPVGRWLKIAQPDPQGVLIAGAHIWAREIAQALKAEGFSALLIDTNPANIAAARRADLPGLQANIASDYLTNEIDLVGIGRLLALTSNDEVNSLAALHFTELFGRAEVYQLPLRGTNRSETVSRPLHGRLLFAPNMTHNELTRRFLAKATVQKLNLTDAFDYNDFREFYGDKVIPLFLIDQAGYLYIFTAEGDLVPQPGQTLIALVDASLDGQLVDAPGKVVDRKMTGDS